MLHLAAQAGVRYAVKNPAACVHHRTPTVAHPLLIFARLRSYVHSNVAGFVTLLEALKSLSPIPALVYASSSSIYGLNEKTPFAESDQTDRPASLYAGAPPFVAAAPRLTPAQRRRSRTS